MKDDLHEIEELLRESRLPDEEFKNSRHKIWQQLIIAQRKRRKHIGPFFLRSWIWTFASLLLIAFGIIAMLWLASAR